MGRKFCIMCQCVFCSSVSSSLSGAAANCWDDILNLKLSQISENRKALINRILGTPYINVSSRVRYTGNIT